MQILVERQRKHHALSRAEGIGRGVQVRDDRGHARPRQPVQLDEHQSRRCDLAARIDFEIHGRGRRSVRRWAVYAQRLAARRHAFDHRSHGAELHLASNLQGRAERQVAGVFNGKVFVRENAHGTDAQQSNKNLLLSNDARVDTKPQLEIFNDDVKCAHGATVGQLEEEELFYLLTRGLPRTLARNLLTYGFAEEIINKIDIESIKTRTGCGRVESIEAEI